MTIAEYLAASGRSQADLARAIGCDRGNFNRIVKGKQAPTPQQALALEKASNGQLDAGALSPFIRDVRAA